MKKLSFILVSLFFFGQAFCQTEQTKKDVNDLKEEIKGFLKNYSAECTSYSITANGHTISGNFTIYSFKAGIDTTITNYSLYEYYFSGQNGEFLIITIVRNGMAEVFVDLDFDGKLDEYISNGKKLPCSNSLQKSYAFWIDAGAHG